MRATEVRHEGLAPELLLAMLESDGDVVVVSDRRGVVRWVSPSVTDVLGWHAEEFLLVGPHLVHPDDQDLAPGPLNPRHARPGHHHVGEVRHLTADGGWCPLEVTMLNLLDEHDVVVTRYRDLQHRDRMAVRGPLVLDDVTGLPRRSAVHRALAGRLSDADGAVAVLFLDLDGFKAVNDRFGHAAGDEVLREVAARLQHRLRDTELLARWGGDEFVVLVDVPGPALAATVAARLHQAVTEQAFEIGGIGVQLGVSVGVALGAAGDDVDGLVHDADRAMYRAKRAGGGIATAREAA